MSETVMDVGAAAKTTVDQGYARSQDFFEDMSNFFGGFSSFLLKAVIVIVTILVVYFALKYCTKNFIQRLNSALCCDDYEPDYHHQHRRFYRPSNHVTLQPRYQEPLSRERMPHYAESRFHPVHSYPDDQPTPEQFQGSNGYETDRFEFASDITPKAPKRQRRDRKLYGSRDDSLLTSSTSSDSQRRDGKKMKRSERRRSASQGSERRHRPQAWWQALLEKGKSSTRHYAHQKAAKLASSLNPTA